ncbi:MAG: lipoyl(octanoyl) transferase LipB [Aureispira sp.]
MGKEIFYKDLGVVPYQQAWDLQTRLFEQVIERKLYNRKATEEEQKTQFHYLLFCEHPHVYTLGRNGKERHLLLDEVGLQEKEATFHKINRGGDITYHGYGQVVGYPILDMDEFFTDIARYVRILEETVIRMLAAYDIEGTRIKGLSGVWIEAKTERARKICAVGVHLSRWTTMHGFALNVNTDLTYFEYIVPCGIDDKAVTSMQKELGREVDMEAVKVTLKAHFAELMEAHYKKD